jgi:hypothetical protein
MIRNKPRGATVFGIALGKNVLHVIGTDSNGNLVQRPGIRRDTLLASFERGARALVGMEASWIAMAGEKAAGARAFCPYYPGSIREALREVEQERHHRCRSYRTSFDTLHDAFCRCQTAGTSGPTGPSSHPGPDGWWLKPLDLSDACLLPRIRRANTASRGRIQNRFAEGRRRRRIK